MKTILTPAVLFALQGGAITELPAKTYPVARPPEMASLTLTMCTMQVFRAPGNESLVVMGTGAGSSAKVVVPFRRGQIDGQVRSNADTQIANGRLSVTHKDIQIKVPPSTDWTTAERGDRRAVERALNEASDRLASCVRR